MAEHHLSVAAVQFIESRIPSLLHLEILLLLRRDTSQWMNAADVAAILHVSDGTAEKALEQLGAANLLDVRIRSSLSFRFAPVAPADEAVIDEIAAVHHDDRAAVEALFARRHSGPSAARAFADAFRLRRKMPRA